MSHNHHHYLFPVCPYPPKETLSSENINSQSPSSVLLLELQSYITHSPGSRSHAYLLRQGLSVYSWLSWNSLSEIMLPLPPED